MHIDKNTFLHFLGLKLKFPNPTLPTYVYDISKTYLAPIIKNHDYATM